MINPQICENHHTKRRRQIHPSPRARELTLGGIGGIRRVLHLETKNEKRTTRSQSKAKEHRRWGNRREREERENEPWLRRRGREGGGESEGLGRLGEADIYIGASRPRSKTLSGFEWANLWSRSKL